MERIKHDKQLCVGLALIILDLIFIVLIILIGKVNKPHGVVLPALKRVYAEGMVKENECYIVHIADPEEMGTGGWYYMDGEEKKKIMLSGRNPTAELSYIFLESNQNSFLVKGKIDDEVIQSGGCPTLNVESWYIIAPIKRNYGNREYRKEQRFFYPKDYLDIYDLEQGDYIPLESQES